MAQGRTKKALTQKSKGISTKGVQVPRVECEEGVDNDEQLIPPVFHGSIVDEDPMLWLEGLKKALRVIKAFDDEAMELAAYQLRDVANAWFEMWEKERDEDDGPPTWEEFEEAFMANFIPEEDREAKATKFEQLKQGNKSVQEYYMEFIRLSKHAPHMVKIEKAKIRRFVGSLAYHIKDMTSAAAVGMTAFSSVVGFAKHIEKDRQQRREEKEHNKKARTTCMFNGASSGGGRDSSNKDSLAPAQSSHQSEASAEVITGILLVCSHNAYAIMDPSSTFSYVTPYFAINLRLEPEQLSESFLVSTPVGELVKVTRVYRGCIVSVQGRNTKADLIELEMVDFDVIMESEPPVLQSMPVVREFLEVFPDDFPGLPPKRIIDFGIDLMPGTQPISIPPYRMAPVELNELRE
ncbi:uncharacterized protein [Nicotiana sylvestris]|uniref:uncharacterized protein n=1 Tax=Nicotiana sylvestris TaxID=4096 RepID=UPI00388C3C42